MPYRQRKHGLRQSSSFTLHRQKCPGLSTRTAPAAAAPRLGRASPAPVTHTAEENAKMGASYHLSQGRVATWAGGLLTAVGPADPVRRQLPTLRRDRGRSSSVHGVSSSATSSGSASTGSHSCAQRMQAQTHGGVSGGELIARHAVQPQYRHGGNDRLASFSLQTGTTDRARRQLIPERPESLCGARAIHAARNKQACSRLHTQYAQHGETVMMRREPGARCVRAIDIYTRAWLSGKMAARRTAAHVSSSTMSFSFSSLLLAMSRAVTPTCAPRAVSQHERQPSRAPPDSSSADRTPRSLARGGPRAAAADTHIALRVDVRAKPHELGGRGGAAVGSSVHKRSPATLQHAQRPRSATISRARLSPSHARTLFCALMSAPSRTSSAAVAVWRWPAGCMSAVKPNCSTRSARGQPR